MKYILLLIPVFGWGAIPLLTSGVKNSSVCNQIIGTGLGTLIPALFSWLIFKPEFDVGTFWLAVIAGVLWAVGQLGQYVSFKRVGISTAMPILTSFQLIGVPIVGTIIFGEWPDLTSKVFGVIGIILLIFGVICTLQMSSRTNNSDRKNDLLRVVIILAITTWGYVISDSIPKAMTGSVFLIFLDKPSVLL